MRFYEKERKKSLILSQRENAIDRVKAFFKQYRIETWELDEKGWNTVLEILRDFNVKAPDSVHVATALESGCNLFVTNDEELGREISKKINWANPIQALNLLKKRSHDKQP